MKHNKIVIFLVLFTLMLLKSNQHIHAQSYTINTILTTKTELVPGTGLTISKINNTVLPFNNQTIIVDGWLSDGTRGFVRYSGTNIQLIVKTVKSQPLNKSVFLDVWSPVINNNGEIVFCGNLSGKNGIYQFNDNGITPILQDGDSISGAAATLEFSDCGLSVNNNMEIVFSAKLSDGRSGIFMLKDETIEAIVVKGDQFPILSGNEILVLADNPVINDIGGITFRGGYLPDDTASTDEIKSSIFLYRDGEIVPVYLPGQEAPGTKGQVFFDFIFRQFSIGNNAEILFWADYQIPDRERRGSGAPTRLGLFLWSNGSIKPLIITWDPVPGFKSIYKNFAGGALSQNSINNAGEMVAVYGALVSKRGVMLFSDDKAVPVVTSQYPPPDVPTKISFMSTAAINNNGDVAFIGNIESSDKGDLIASEGVFLATRENVSFEIVDIQPAKGTIDSKMRIEVTGTGFQPGALVSFSKKGIFVLTTKFKTSTTLIVTVNVTSDAKPGFYDVIVTNPSGESLILDNSFLVVK